MLNVPNDGTKIENNVSDKFTFHEYFTKGGKKIIVDAIPFHPYYTVKDIVGVVGFLLVFCAVIFFAPEGGGFFLEPPNFEPANPMKTPDHIAPVWYFTPFYAILRAVPDQLFGAIFMFLAIIFLALLPWLDCCPVRSVRYRSNFPQMESGEFLHQLRGVRCARCSACNPNLHAAGTNFLVHLFCVLRFTVVIQ